MDIKTPASILGLIFASAFLTACCQQPKAHGGGGYSKANKSNSGNCHNHNDNAKRGTTRHCHAHANGNNHTHSYGNRKATVQKKATNNDYRYPSYDNSKRKGNYRGSVDRVIDPYARNVMRDYREY